MKLREQHIKHFVSFLEGRGYTGPFMNEVGLDDTLTGHLTIFLKNKGELARKDKLTIPLAVQTDNGPKTAFTSCQFIIRYHPEKGFHVNSFSIHRKEQLRDSLRILTFKSPKQMMTAKFANNLIRLSGKGIKKEFKRAQIQKMHRRPVVLKAMGVLLFCCAASFCQAQTFNEWFKQKKTQIKYLVDQIGSLQAYAIVLEKGYHVARDGLTTIGDIKNGEFHLHGDYFSSLKSINPLIAKYPRFASIMVIQAGISGGIKKAKQDCAASGQFTQPELSYLEKVYNGILDGCSSDLTELTSLITKDELEMTDDERLKRIDLIYRDISDKNEFVQSFSNQARLLAANRKRELTDTRQMKSMYDIQK